MARRSTPYTQADMTRLLKAVLAAGVPVERIVGMKLTSDGPEILFGEQKQEQPSSTNEWDEVLKK